MKSTRTTDTIRNMVAVEVRRCCFPSNLLPRRRHALRSHGNDELRRNKRSDCLLHACLQVYRIADLSSEAVIVSSWNLSRTKFVAGEQSGRVTVRERHDLADPAGPLRLVASWQVLHCSRNTRLCRFPYVAGSGLSDEQTQEKKLRSKCGNACLLSVFLSRE